MVAVITGLGLGLHNSSGQQLGGLGLRGLGLTGGASKGLYVNGVTGNVVLQRQDEYLKGSGLDIPLLRTYNSQGQLSDGSWRLGFSRSVMGLTGKLNQVGSTIKRIQGDGHEVIYRYHEGRKCYEGVDGQGANDQLKYDASKKEWIWRDGLTGIEERYSESAGGSLTEIKDEHGKRIEVLYGTDGRVRELRRKGGISETLLIEYDVKGNITQLLTTWQDGKVTQSRTRVRYGYDGINRLAKVRVDLTPEDGKVDDGKVYETVYGYEGNSQRINLIKQSDGAELRLSYAQFGEHYRVSEIKERQDDKRWRTSYLSYDVLSKKTTLKDSAGSETVLSYDGQGNLLSVVSGGELGFKAVYNDDGRVLRLEESRGSVTLYEYDERGNTIRTLSGLLASEIKGHEITAALLSSGKGLLIQRDYNEGNKLLAERRREGTEERVVRYVYNERGRLLRYRVGESGEVTEWRYDGMGRQTSQLRYCLRYEGKGALTEKALNGWLSGRNLTQTERTDTVYDLRGLLSQTVSYSQTNEKGEGIKNGSEIRTHYVYDQNGDLLERRDSQGGKSLYRYDGLNRLIYEQDALGIGKTWLYDDASRRVSLTLANGLTMVSQYNHAGELIAQLQKATETLGEARYDYDVSGRLIRERDETGGVKRYFYDAQGRKIGELDKRGYLTEYEYGQGGVLIRTYRYAIQTAENLRDKGSLSALRPKVNGADRVTHWIYDEQGRLLRETDASGSITGYVYDSQGRLQEQVRYTERIAFTRYVELSALKRALTVSELTVKGSTHDRRETLIYDTAGRTSGTIDAQGYLTEQVYDEAGHLIKVLHYGKILTQAERTTRDMAKIRAKAGGVISETLHYYDGRGLLVGSKRAEGYLTEYVYDNRGQKIKTIQYSVKAKAGETIDTIRPNGDEKAITTTYRYDKKGQLTEEKRLPDGFVTRYRYDTQGLLLSTRRESGKVVRENEVRYDRQGRVISELSAQGHEALRALGEKATTEQINEIWRRHGIHHRYDKQGRKLSTTEAKGQTSRFYYSAGGELLYRVNGMGEVTGYRYKRLWRTDRACRL